MPRQRIASTERPQIAAMYQNGATLDELGSRYGVTARAIAYVLDTQHVPRRGVRTAGRKYAVHDDAFSQLNPEVAYWLGFLMADGTVLAAEGFRVELQLADHAHLESLRSFVGDFRRPVVVTARGTAALTVKSEGIGRDLRRFGIVERKSYGACASPELTKYPSFWLGIIDGDGSVGDYFHKKRGRTYPLITVAGSRPLMEQFATFVAAVTHGNQVNVYRTRGDVLTQVRVNGKRAVALAQILYEASPVALARKHLPASRWLNTLQEAR